MDLKFNSKYSLGESKFKTLKKFFTLEVKKPFAKNTNDLIFVKLKIKL